MQAKTDHKRGFVWGLAFAVTMTISSIWGQAVSSGQFVRAAQVEVTPVPAAQQTNIPQRFFRKTLWRGCRWNTL